MKQETKPREFFISRCKDSTDEDKLTHIVLFEYNADKDPMCVIPKEDYEKVIDEVKQLRSLFPVQLDLLDQNEKLLNKVYFLTKALESISADFGTDHCDGNTIIAKEALDKVKELETKQGE